MIFYERIRIPRISGNFGTCADSVYQALFFTHEREPGFEATCAGATNAKSAVTMYNAESQEDWQLVSSDE